MHRISIAIALTIFLLVSLVTAQQTTNNPSTNFERTSSPAPPPGPIIGGDGTANYIAIWATSNYLLSSVMYQANGSIGIGTTTPQATLDVNGSLHVTDMVSAGGYFIGNQRALYINGATTAVGVYTGGGTDDNTFMGADSGESLTSGGANSFYGIWSGINISSGSLNTFIGAGAGGYTTTGSTDIMIGAYGGENNMTGNNDIYVGNSGASTNNESNTMRLGLPYSSQSGGCGSLPPPCGQTSTYIAGIYGVNVAGVPVQINSNGQLGAQTSSLRFKEQVRDMGDSTAALMKLRPVTFLYKPEYANGQRALQYGLIAEEVAKVYPELVAYDNDGQPYSVRYQYLSTMLLNEVQKQYRRAAAQAKVITTQEQKIKELEQRLSRLEALVGARANVAELDPEHGKTSGGGTQ